MSPPRMAVTESISRARAGTRKFLACRVARAVEIELLSYTVDIKTRHNSIEPIN